MFIPFNDCDTMSFKGGANMELYDTIHCKCGCKYEVNQNITMDKISCPNCGTKYEHSEQVLKRLRLAKTIDSNTELKIWSHILAESTEEFLKPESLEEILDKID